MFVVCLQYRHQVLIVKGKMLTVENPEMIREMAGRSRLTVHKVKRMLGWGAPLLEDHVVAWYSQRGHNSEEVREWYKQKRMTHISRHKMERRVEKHIAGKQHRAKIHSLLSG